MPLMFSRNYPHPPGQPELLSVPERVAAPVTYTGRGVVMAFVDSGFYPHPDIAGRIRAYVDATTRLVRERDLAPEPSNMGWHGQMTSVIAAGDGRTSGGRYRGIACNAELVLIKVSNHKLQIKEADILRGLKWLVKHAHRYNVRVVNVSVGGDFPSDDPKHPLHVAIRALTRSGVCVLVSAGNSGAATLLPPATAAEAITVGGYDDHNSLDVADWTGFNNSYGMAYDGAPKPDVVATAAWLPSPIMPGTDMAREAPWLHQMLALKARDVRGFQRLARQGDAELYFSKVLADHPEAILKDIAQERIHAHKIVDGAHQHVDGTSVSVAVASSVVAQLLEAHPRLTPREVKERLMATALRLPNVPVERQGAGVINATAAIG
ncbi:MAG: S8 family serine peptidase [Chloroflexota bacterium]|nr:S8 family serine peptidase [Chloroflexota bacterium]